MIGVAVIEDHPLYRKALLSELDGMTGVETVASAGSVEEFDVGSHRRPDVVILDLNLPGLGGTHAVLHLRAAGLPVLVVSAAASSSDVLDAVAAGAAGYLSKHADGTEVAAAVRSVGAGGTYISPTLASHLLTARADPLRTPVVLTERERTILGLVAAGETDRDIAAELGISIATVRSHLDRIRDKTGRRRRPDLTRLAYEHAITPAPDSPRRLG